MKTKHNLVYEKTEQHKCKSAGYLNVTTFFVIITDNERQQSAKSLLSWVFNLHKQTKYVVKVFEWGI